MGKKVYLLGAGAAFLYGAPSTKDITHSLAEISPLNNVVHRRLKQYIGTEDYNFETLLSALEYIITDTEQRGKNSYHYSPLPALSCLKCCFRRGNAKQAYLESVNHIIERIVPYTLNKDEAKDDLILRHFTQAEENHIYSLNYDRIIPEVFQKNSVTVFDGTINGSAFKQPINSFVSSPNTFFNLHGNIYLYQNPLSLYDVYQSDKPVYLSSLYPVNGGNPRERCFFTPIISGYSKTQHIMSKPFSFGISSLSIDLQECDEFEVIGYSFSDNHINGLIASFFDFWNKRMTVVDYFPKEEFQNRVEVMQDILSFFYKTRPDNYILQDGMLVYKSQLLSMFSEGVTNYLERF